MPSTQPSIPSLKRPPVNEGPAILSGAPFVSRVGDLRAGFKAHSLFASLGYAWEGLTYATRTQRNFRAHLAMATTAVLLASGLHVGLLEWAMLWGCIGLVLFAELLNTVVELLVDMVTEGRFDLRAKAIKDMAAGAVFVTAMASLACGLCIFLPHLLKLVSH